MRRSHKFHAAASAGAPALVLVLFAVACNEQPAAPADTAPKEAAIKPVQVATVPASQQPMPRYITLTGTLVADRESNVAADVTGKVLELPVDRGTLVKAGGVLAVLDRRNASIVSREAEANVSLAQANWELARSNCERADGLLQSGAIGKAEFDRTKSSCETSKLSVDAAQVRREAALKTLGDAVIRAPFAGVVSERRVDVGEYLQPQSQVVHLVAIDPLRLRLSVPEQLVGQVQQGMTIELQVSAYPDTWFPATLKYLSAALREQTRDLLVEGVVPNPEHKLRPGMFAVARVVMPKAVTTVVPQASLHFDGELARLFVAHKGVLEERIVELGAKDAQLVEVRRGVKSGEAVVSPFSLDAKDGAPIAQ